jgi:class 3 adenylate cyclase
MPDSRQKLYVKCLLLAHNCEEFCKYYVLSYGKLHTDDCRRSALAFLRAYRALLKEVPAVANDSFIGDRGKTRQIKPILLALGRFGKRGDVQLDFPALRMAFAILTGNLAKALGVAEPETRMTSSKSKELETLLKWRGYFPPPIPEQMEQIMEWASKRDTIVVVGDIRRSQDMMKYAAGERDFLRRMEKFLQKTRKMLRAHCGLFDKFTGDGFLAYFNRNLCNWQQVDYVRCFIGFLSEYQAFTTKYFELWQRTLKKLPRERVGLAIGADLGSVTLHNEEDHLIAIGEPVVWATIMASAAKAGEVMVNNRLYEVLRGRRELVFEPREETSKSGESFLGRLVRLKR